MNSHTALPAKSAQAIWISVAPDRFSKSWKNISLTWDELCKHLSSPKVTAETFDEYRAMTKEARADRKDVGGFVGGPITGGRRLARSVTSRTLITLDVDYATPDFWTDFTLKYGCAAFLYATHSSSPDKPRFRLIIPLSREALPDQYEAVARRVAGDLGIDLFDLTTFELSRLMFLPSVSSDVTYYYKGQVGPALDVDKILGSYRDWKDSSQWPVSSKVQEIVKREISKKRNPTTIPGPVGAFCRVYDIKGAIEAYLPDVYAPTDHEDRYTYIKGSTVAGLVVYDGGLFAYSNHGTDPISGREENAFDLVRIHKFGHLDKEVKSATNFNKYPSHLAMRERVLQDKSVTLKMTEEQLAEAMSIFGEWTAEEKVWLKELKKDSQGRNNSSIDNVCLILQNDPNIKGVIAYDEFRDAPILKGLLPWRENKEGDYWTDFDKHALYRYLEKNYRIVVNNKIDSGFQNTLMDNKFHPIRDYLESVIWDGKNRIDKLLIDYFGAEDTNENRVFMRKTLIGAVSRIFNPGSKFDTMLVLISPEGRNKSSFVAKLGMKWYSSDFGPLNDQKTAMEQLKGVWLMEVAELAGLKRSDIELIKHFLTKTEDQFRKAYAENKGYWPRQCVFIGTTNKSDFITDSGENRRFWPVECSITEPTKDVWTDLTEYEVNQIWAEAVSAFIMGEAAYLSPEEREAANKVRDRHREEDERFDDIEEYLNMPRPENWDKWGFFERREYNINPARWPIEGVAPADRITIREIHKVLFDKEPYKEPYNLIQALAKKYLAQAGWVKHKYREGNNSVRGYILPGRYAHKQTGEILL